MKSLVLFLTFLTTAAFADYSFVAENHSIIHKKDIKWSPAPAGLPKGAEIAVLHGDPSKAEEFTMRVKFPANFSVAPHSHPGEEHLTILEGTLHIGMGDTVDRRAFRTLTASDFVVMSPGANHYVHAATPVILQIHSVGPWDIKYVNPSDDPRGR